MKQKIYTITTLFILLSATFGQTVFAQTAKKQAKVLTQDEIDKRDVIRFVGKFTKSFEKVKDINKIPNKFFTDDFKKNLSKVFDEVGGDLAEFKKLDSQEKTDFMISIVNLVNLSGIWLALDKNFNLEKLDDDKYFMNKVFPPKVLKMLKQSRVFNIFMKFEDSDQHEPFSITELSEAVIILKKAVAQYQTFLKNYNQKVPKFYAGNFKAFRSMFDYYDSDLCKGKNCFGYAENTKVFEQTFAFLTIHFVRENERLKIFYIDFVKMD
jgi:hypothetical protein